nr:MAG TPA: hypothetical protein [Microviridae sp.]
MKNGSILINNERYRCRRSIHRSSREHRRRYSRTIRQWEHSYQQ